MKWEASGTGRIGGRNEQQDSVGCFASRDGDARLLVVADGMGGHRGGALASQTLVEIAESNWESCGGAPDDPRQFLEDLCQRAHTQINLRGLERDLEPHSTVVALIVLGGQAFWVHVGDSRLYHFRGDTLEGRTKDHSVLQLLVESGEVSEEEMATHPDQNKLLRSIGGEDPPKTMHGYAALRSQDRFLLCSDGFWETITTDEMAAALAARKLDASLADLADRAAQRGGDRGDNIAVAAVRPLMVERGRRIRTPFVIGTVLAVFAGIGLFVSYGMNWQPSVPPTQTPAQGETDVDAGSEAGQDAQLEAAEGEPAVAREPVEENPEPRVPNAVEEDDTLQEPETRNERFEPIPRGNDAAADPYDRAQPRRHDPASGR